MKRNWPGWGALLSLVVLSALSDYRITNVGSLNWDIVLMLTPYGITRFWLMPGHYLQPYYSEKSPLSPIWDQPEVAVVWLVTVAFGFYFLEKSKRKT